MKIDLESLTEQGIGLNVVLSPKQLKDVVNQIVYVTLKDMTEQARSKTKDELMTPNDVCGFLKIDLSTLWRWDKREYLKPIYIGGKKRYLRSEVECRFTSEAK